MDNMMDKKDVKIDEWAVVATPNGRYLGRVVGTLEKSAPHEDGFGEVKKMIVEAISNGDCVELCPAFDFMAPLRPVQGPNGQMGMQRDPIVVPVDFTLSPVPVYVKATSVYFCADMQKEDKDTYKNFVTSTLDTAIRARAGRSNIELAGHMPAIKGVPRG